MRLLEVRDLHKTFRGLSAVNGLDMHVDEGETLGLIGPNGAGKTTTFNVITGFLKPTSGAVIFRGEEIGGLRPDKIARKGLVRTFQANRLFYGKTVLENMVIAHHLHARAGALHTFLGVRSYRKQEGEVSKRTDELLRFMGLAEVKDQLTNNLPHGHQRCLGVAMALAGDPKLLLLDEPVTGMVPSETSLFMETIRRIAKERSITVVLVEHDMKAVMGLCGRVVVLSYGRKIAEGTPDQIMNNEQVIQAYLGSE